MEHMLQQSVLAFLQLEALAQLMTVDGQLCCQLTDLIVRMVHEVGLSLEALLSTVLCSLKQDLTVTGIVELQSVGAQVIGDILSHCQIGFSSVLRLYIFIDNLLTMTNHSLYQQALNLFRLFVDAVQTYELRLGSCLWVLLLISLSVLLLFFLLYVFGNHAVHRVQQRLFLDTQSL